MPSPNISDKDIVAQTGGWGNTYDVHDDDKSKHSCITNELGKVIFNDCKDHNHVPCRESKANKSPHPNYDPRCKKWWRFGSFILNERIPKEKHLGRETIMKFTTQENHEIICYG